VRRHRADLVAAATYHRARDGGCDEGVAAGDDLDGGEQFLWLRDAIGHCARKYLAASDLLHQPY
jgi:hypothetical protein